MSQPSGTIQTKAPSGDNDSGKSRRVPAVVFEGVTRSFGDVKAVDNVDLQIEDGEFFTMLGPSGSGKTTCLRLIAGFETPTAGEVRLHGEVVNRKAPYERDVNTVFQDYALFPHMTVGDNVGYGLLVRKVAKPERRRLVGDALELVHLEGLAGRRPAERCRHPGDDVCDALNLRAVLQRGLVGDQGRRGDRAGRPADPEEEEPEAEAP